MNRKHFQRDYGKVSVAVDFVIEPDGRVTAIQLNASEEIFNLPKHPTLERWDGKWLLCENSLKEINGEEKLVVTPVVNKYTKDIVENIIKWKDENTAL